MNEADQPFKCLKAIYISFPANGLGFRGTWAIITQHEECCDWGEDRGCGRAGKEHPACPASSGADRASEGFQVQWLSVWVSLKQILRQEFKDKQLLWERREIPGNKTGKAAKEGVLSSKLAL